MFEEMPDWNGVFPAYLDGDHMVMGPELGAAIASVPPTNLALFYGYQIPGEEVEGRAALALVVGRRRAARDLGEQGGRALLRRVLLQGLPAAIRHWDGKKQEQPNTDIYLIFDGNYRERYPLGSFMPGQELPEGMVVVGEHAARAGAAARDRPRPLRADARALQRERREGRGPGLRARLDAVGDPPGRRHGLQEPAARPAEQAAVPRGAAAAGLRRHQLARPQVEPRRAGAARARPRRSRASTRVGNSAALLDIGGGYQSGTSNSRAITWGYVAGRHAAARR